VDLLISINNIDQLSIPDTYKETLTFMLFKLRDFPVVKDIILFGSCARQNLSDYSDIDLALVVSEPISPEEEWSIDYSIRNWDSNLACDVIFVPERAFDGEIRGDTIIRSILQEGVRLSGLLSGMPQKCLSGA
jgi:predicted nucleotidyltransferase